MPQKVVIIGNSFATRLGVIRSLANQGYEINVVDIGFHKGKSGKSLYPIDYYSKYVDKYFLFERSEGREGLINLLIRECANKSQKGVLIPTSDFSAVTIDENQERLKEFFLFPHVHHTEGAVSHWMNKMIQKELASQIGLRVAKAVILEKGEKHFAIPSNIDYPCFTKPLASIGGGKRCLKKCDSEKALSEVLAIAEKNNIEKILIEEYINIEKEYAVLGFSDGNDVVIPGIIQFVEGCKSHPGIALKGKIKPIAGFEDTIRQFKQLILRIGYIGIFDIDFVSSGDKIYFVELNLRIGGSAYAVSKMGCNLPAMYVKFMTGKSIKDDTSCYVQTTKTYLNERMLMDDWMAGKRSTCEYKKIVNSSDIYFVSDEEDPKPQEQLQKEFLRKIISPKRIVKRIIRVIKK